MPDIIISDLRLENEMDGTEVIDAIREEYNCEIPAIIITGETSPNRINDALSTGCSVAYKPIDGIELKALIQEELASNKA